MTDNQRRAITTVALLTCPIWFVPFLLFLMLHGMWRCIHDLLWGY